MIGGEQPERSFLSGGALRLAIQSTKRLAIQSTKTSRCQSNGIWLCGDPRSYGYKMAITDSVILPATVRFWAVVPLTRPFLRTSNKPPFCDTEGEAIDR